MRLTRLYVSINLQTVVGIESAKLIVVQRN